MEYKISTTVLADSRDLSDLTQADRRHLYAERVRFEEQLKNAIKGFGIIGECPDAQNCYIVNVHYTVKEIPTAFKAELKKEFPHLHFQPTTYGPESFILMDHRQSECMAADKHGIQREQRRQLYTLRGWMGETACKWTAVGVLFLICVVLLPGG